MQDEQPSRQAEPAAESGKTFSFGAFRFDSEGPLLFENGSRVRLGPKPLAVLKCLLERPGKVAPKQYLLDSVWDGISVNEESLGQAINRLRRALGDDPENPTYIQTIHRRGYRFIAPVVAEPDAVPGTEERGWLATYAGEAASPGMHVPQRRRASMLWALVAVLAVTSATAGIALLRQPATPPTTRLMMVFPDDQPFALSGQFALSPDGTRLVYLAQLTSTTTQLFVKAIDQFEAVPLPGTENARYPFFSPDGNWVGFSVNQGSDTGETATLKKVSLSGGLPVKLAEAPNSLAASWGPDGFVYFAPDGFLGGLYRVSADGGQPQVVTTPDHSKGEAGHLAPHALPDGKSLLFSVVPTLPSGGSPIGGVRADAQVVVASRTVLLSLETGEQRTLLGDGVVGAYYVRSGHLVYHYSRQPGMWARPFDLASLQVGGPEVHVVDGAIANVGKRTFSDTGILAYMAVTSPGRPVWLNRDGAASPLPLDLSRCLFPSLSPDGKQLALTCSETEGSSSVVWLGNLGSGTSIPVTSGGHDSTPIWTPDGEHITYGSRRGESWGIYWRPADGDGPEQQLWSSDHPVYPQSWSPDGKVLALLHLLPETNEGIWLLPLEGERKPRVFIDSPAYESGARFSPDGDWIAYHSNDSGEWHTYARAYPGPGPTIRISTEPGGWPVWSRDGSELFYMTARGERFMVVEIGDALDFNPGRARPLFETANASYRRTRIGPVFDVAPDAGRFVVVQRDYTAGLHVVLNWFEELKQRVPTGR